MVYVHDCHGIQVLEETHQSPCAQNPGSAISVPLGSLISWTPSGCAWAKPPDSASLLVSALTLPFHSDANLLNFHVKVESQLASSSVQRRLKNPSPPRLFLSSFFFFSLRRLSSRQLFPTDRLPKSLASFAPCFYSLLISLATAKVFSTSHL